MAIVATGLKNQLYIDRHVKSFADIVGKSRRIGAGIFNRTKKLDHNECNQQEKNQKFQYFFQVDSF